MPSEPVTPAYKSDESEEDHADYDEVRQLNDLHSQEGG
jgi:hypothetical protein